jgi:hypothetical protein
MTPLMVDIYARQHVLGCVMNVDIFCDDSNAARTDGRIEHTRIRVRTQLCRELLNSHV